MCWVAAAALPVENYTVSIDFFDVIHEILDDGWGRLSSETFVKTVDLGWWAGVDEYLAVLVGFLFDLSEERVIGVSGF